MSSNNNNSWSRGAKITDDYKDSFSRKKEKKEKIERDTSYGNIKKSYYQDKDPIPIKKEFNLFDHPEMKPKSSLDNHDEKISYLDKCTIQKKEDIETKNTLPLGWIAFKGEKGSRESKVSRNNIDFYDTIKDSYTEYELENIRLQEEYEDRINLEMTLDNIYLKRLNDSIKYLNLTNENNIFLDELKRQEEIDTKLDKLDEDFETESESESESDSEYYDSD